MAHGRGPSLPGLRPEPTGIVRFLRSEAAGGVLLAIATLVALVLANSSLHEAFVRFWHVEAGFLVGELHFEQSLLHWVDDALMALFFFVVGLEIKREFVVGELSSLRGAALPVIAAVGGMAVPAMLYLAFNWGGVDQRGWGVPMATDIAFALGILALLGSRAPAGLKVFLSALAIADDLGAIVVIALFYSKGIELSWLLWGLIPIVVLILMNRMRVDEPLAYLAVGSILWFLVLNSGIHATVAGVIAALLVPTTAKISPSEFTDVCRIAVDEIDELDQPGQHTLADYRQQELALGMARAAELSSAPLQRLEFALLPLTTYLILPLFAIANAGVRFVGGAEIELVSPLVFGVIVGLVVGKPLGVVLASWIAVRSGIASLPSGVSWRHIIGAGMLGGVGFTMSMFVGNLAFGVTDHGDDVKVAVLIASLLAGTIGYLWLRVSPATGSDEADAS